MKMEMKVSELLPDICTGICGYDSLIYFHRNPLVGVEVSWKWGIITLFSVTDKQWDLKYYEVFHIRNHISSIVVVYVCTFSILLTTDYYMLVYKLIRAFPNGWKLY